MVSQKKKKKKGFYICILDLIYLNWYWINEVWDFVVSVV